MCNNLLVEQQATDSKDLFSVVYYRSGVGVLAKSFRLGINGMNSKLPAC